MTATRDRDTGEPLSLGSTMAASIVAGLQTAADDHSGEADRLRAECRAGNPLPLVALLWPAVVLDSWQADIVTSVFDPAIREVFVKGNAGCGKGAAAALAVCLWYDVHPDARVIITRDSFDKAVSVMFAEVVTWFRRMALAPIGAVLSAEIGSGYGRRISVANPATEEGFSGVHGENVLFLFDEATAVPDARYDLADTQATKFIALANPRTTGGRFREAFPASNPDETATILGAYGRRRCITVGGMDCRNVKEGCLRRPIAPIGGVEIDGVEYSHGEPIDAEDYQKVKPIIPGQICFDEFKGHLEKEGWWAQIFAHGRFPEEDPERQMIPSSWLHAPMQRWKRWRSLRRKKTDRIFLERLDRILPIEAIGLDVALSTSGDESVLCVGGSRGVRALHSIRVRDATQLTDWVLGTMSDQYSIDLTREEMPVGVDYGGGFGNAVGDPLRRQGVRIIEIRGNDSSNVDPRVYANMRSEMYGELAARLDPQGQFASLPFMLPEDQMLRDELAAVERLYVERDGLKFRVTPKVKVQGFKDVQSLHQKLGRSPDRADAVCYFWRALQWQGADLGEWLEAGAL